MFRKIKDAKKAKQFKKRFLDSDVNIHSIIDAKTTLFGMNTVGSKTNIKGTSVGICSIIGQNCYLPNSTIGKFSSISRDVSLIEYTHPINFISTYPGFFNTINNLKFGKGSTIFDEVLKNKNGSIIDIGNDVWIGRHVLIKGGVSIGDGAIVGMGSVVTKDVPERAVMVGVPAKVLRIKE